MREQEKPFILFRRNRFIYNITPRNASGWMQMGVWMALFVPLVAGFAAYDSTRAADSAFGLADAVFLLGLDGSLQGNAVEANGVAADGRTLGRNFNYRKLEWTDRDWQLNLTGHFDTGTLSHTDKIER